MANSKKTKAANIEGLVPPKIQGIRNDRDRPANSGWCGAENCKHLTHQHFNKPAKAAV